MLFAIYKCIDLIITISAMYLGITNIMLPYLEEVYKKVDSNKLKDIFNNIPFDKKEID